MLIVNNLPPFYVVCYLPNCVNTAVIIKDMIDKYRHVHKSHLTW